MVARSNTSTSLKVRYGLFGLSFLLFAVAYLINWLSDSRSFINIIIQSAGGFAMLIYVPMAIVVSVRDSESTWDHAAGEIAYLVVEAIAWIASGITAAVYTSTGSCYFPSTSYSGRIREQQCKALSGAVAAISFVHFVVLIGWTAWIIHVARNYQQSRDADAFKLPTHRLLVRAYVKESHLDLISNTNNAGAIDPFLTPQVQQYHQVRQPSLPLSSDDDNDMSQPTRISVDEPVPPPASYHPPPPASSSAYPETAPPAYQDVVETTASGNRGRRAEKRGQ